MKLNIIAILLLIIAYIYFNIEKYIEIPKEKEDFKNVNIHKFNDCKISVLGLISHFRFSFISLDPSNCFKGTFHIILEFYFLLEELYSK